ncbi:helix-turn-helix transcriptional regulator [Actinoplanes sp. NPDC049548]|uniref:helix-turn-helix domain-containing protein n=1 Tax=Actinoplanes sp. NPDC049548 TaxID=3155152 RepID=UPI003445AE8E
MEIADLGNRLRNRRLATGRTIAAVAADAGLSVPYIANLENGRGNPTLSAVNRLGSALGVELVLRAADDGTEPEPPGALPDTLVQFSRTPRFSSETARLARITRAPEDLTRERLLHAMAAMGALAGRPLAELDWHRLLDAAVLVARA